MMRRLAPILIVSVLAIAAGCDGGNNEASTQPPPATTTSETGKAALERAVRTALSENRRLSVYVLWNNRIPRWAERSTRGPASSAQGAEEGSDVVGQQFRFLECGEVAAARHLGPALDVKRSFAPLPGRPTELLGEDSHGRWYHDPLT